MMAAREWADVVRQAWIDGRTRADARRLRVLAHEDLAAKLTEPPLRIRDPGLWSGFVPPKTLGEDVCPDCPSDFCYGREHWARINNSPVRVQLVAIAAVAYKRDLGDGAGETVELDDGDLS